MILDKETLFADDIAVDGTPVDIDTGVDDFPGPGPGQPLKLFVSVTEGTTGATGVSLQDSDDGSSFSALFTWTGDPAGRTVELTVPSDARRHLRLNIAGTVSGGNWSAGIVLPGVQTAQ